VYVCLSYRIGSGSASQVQRIGSRPENSEPDRNEERRPDLVLIGVAVRGYGRSSHDDVNGVKEDDTSADAGKYVTEYKKGIPKHGGFLAKVCAVCPA
jgi:hypothetical protein